MLCFQVEGAFGLENLRERELPEPVPGPGQVLVQVRAASLNFRDLLMVRGHYDPRLPLPLIPLSDGVGRVVALGPGVEGYDIGERVCPTFSPTWIAGAPGPSALRLTRGGLVSGMLAELVVVDQHALVRPPPYLDDFQAATLPCAALTAWSALVTHGNVKAGDTVLTLGSGGVSIFAIQLARLLGARVVATTSGQEKAKRLRRLGADHVILYTRDQQWGRTVRDWSDGGVDLVVEVGGAGTLAQSLKAVAPGGTVAMIGVLSGVSRPINLLPVLMNQVRVQGVFVGHRQAFRDMCRALDHHRLIPVIDRIFPLNNAPEAFRYMASGAHIGKICIDMGKQSTPEI